MTFDRSRVLRSRRTRCRIPKRRRRPPADRGHRARGDRRADREDRYDPHHRERVTSARRRRARLVKALIQVESAFQSRARSPKGAMGLMQLMPETARQYQARNPYDPASNIEAGTQIPQELPRPSSSCRWRWPRTTPARRRFARFGGIPPYGETQAYVSQDSRAASLTRCAKRLREPFSRASLPAKPRAILCTRGQRRNLL